MCDQEYLDMLELLHRATTFIGLHCFPSASSAYLTIVIEALHILVSTLLI